MCVKHNGGGEKGSSVLDTGVAPGRQEIDIDFAWKHAEVLLADRKSNWGEEGRLRMEGGTWRVAAE